MSGPGATPAPYFRSPPSFRWRVYQRHLRLHNARPSGARAISAFDHGLHLRFRTHLSVSAVFPACLHSTPPLIAIIALALAACATVDPPRPEQPRTTTVPVNIIVPVPCFSEAERPVLPPPSPVDIDHATVDQLAAAMAADDLADQLYAKAVDALFILCSKRIADGTATQPVGK